MKSLLLSSLIFICAIVSISSKQWNSGFNNAAEKINDGYSGTCKLYGYWDHLYAPNKGRSLLSFVNAGKGLSVVQGKEITKQGIKSIPSISGFKSTDSDSKLRKRVGWYKKALHEIGAKNIAFVLLLDEPFSKGFTVKQLETIVDEAHSVFGKNFKFGYTFTRGTILGNRKLPQNVDYVGINFYPFYEAIRGYPQIYTRKEFNDLFSIVMWSARRKAAPNARFFITGQGFYQPGKWRKPPVQSPLWYAEFIQKANDIDGLLWFEYRKKRKKNSRFSGSAAMPNLLKVQKEAFGIVCPK